METLDSIIKFLSSYPVWAKSLVFANLVCMAAVLAFAPRISKEGGQSGAVGSESGDSYELRIEGVELFPPSESAVVQVSAIVNGTVFTYPSVGGVKWLKVAPSMAGQTFRLPLSDRYEIRFEMLKREDGDDTEAKLLSVDTVSFSGGTHSGRYNLHGFDPASRTRSGTIDAEVIFSIGPAG